MSLHRLRRSASHLALPRWQRAHPDFFHGLLTQPNMVNSGSFRVVDAVREMALAWKTLTVYPAEHPASEGACDGALRQIVGLAAPTGSLVLAVGRDALVAGDERVEGAHAARLAARLHELGVGVLRLQHTITEAELGAFLRLLRPLRGGAEAQLSQQLESLGITSIVAEAVDFGSVVATDDLTASTATSPRPASERSLWERILGAQLAGGPGGAAASGPGPTTQGGIGAVIALVNRYLGGSGGFAGAAEAGGADGGPGDGGAVVAGEIAVLSQRIAEAVGEHARASLDPGSAHLVRQVAELIGALPRGLRERVLDVALERVAGAPNGGDAFAELSATTRATDLVASLRRLRSDGRRLAAPAVEWLGGLLDAGAIGTADSSTASADQLKALLAEPDDTPGWRPDEWALELPPAEISRVRPSMALAADLEQLYPTARLQASISLLTDLAERCDTVEDAEALAIRLERLLATLLEAGRLRAATALAGHLESLTRRHAADDPRARVGRRALERAAGTDAVQLLIGQLGGLDPSEMVDLHGFVAAIGQRMARQLLIALCEEEDRGRRRLLFDFLEQGSAAIVEDARRLLADSRWFVVRNMIALLHAMGARSATGDLRRCLEHRDGRVRIEALRALSDLDRELPATLVAKLLADDDPKVAEKMAQLAGNFSGGAEPLLALVAPLDPFGRQRGLRIKALLALGELGDPAILPRIKRFFGSLSIDPLEERRAAFQSLAGYSAAARREFVAKGLSSRDAEIRATCERLREEDERG